MSAAKRLFTKKQLASVTLKRTPDEIIEDMMLRAEGVKEVGVNGFTIVVGCTDIGRFALRMYKAVEEERAAHRREVRRLKAELRKARECKIGLAMQ